jgi:hypothetical protein
MTLEALAHCAPRDRRVHDALLAATAQDKWIASAGFSQLEKIGKPVKRVVPSLLLHAEDASDPWKAAFARRALAAITGDLDTHIPPLIEALADHDGSVRAVASGVADLQGVKPFLERAAREGSNNLRPKAKRLLAKLGSR